MQYDMHYYGTYAMAVAAGIPVLDAETIATCAQFVDDQAVTSWVIAPSGEGILGVATAHHPLEAGARTFFGSAESNDTRPVWVPFHFLPGADGATFKEKMVCRKNSAVANQLLDFYLSEATVREHHGHLPHLMGVAAHVYADTFSHYGFSGLSDEINQIEPDSVEIDDNHSPGILAHINSARDSFLGRFAQAASLGHGAVLTNPDRPYLRWSFNYANGTRSQRDNQATFEEACEALHRRFIQFSAVYYGDAAATPTPWAALAPVVRQVLATEAPADGRVAAWRDAIAGGGLGPVTACKTYDAQIWLDQLEVFREQGNVAGFEQSDPFLFFTAAEYHRSYVLKRLLPQWGLMAA
jgi:hypothetical protein